MTKTVSIQELIDSLCEDYVPEAVQLLTQCGLQAVEALLVVLGNAQVDPYAHDTFAEILVSILLQHRHPYAVGWLGSLVEHENSDVRRRIVTALGELGDIQALPLLRYALQDRQDMVRHSAAYGIINLAYGSESVEALRLALYDEAAHVRYIAVRSLEFLDASDIMLEAARNDLPEVRQIAVYYLGKIQLQAGFERLIDALQDPDDGVCLGAIWSLGQIGDARAAGALHQLVNDPSEHVARAAQEALLKLNRPG